MTDDPGVAVLALLAGNADLTMYEPDDPALQNLNTPPQRPYGVVYVSTPTKGNPRLTGRMTRQTITVAVKVVADTAAACRGVSRKVALQLEHKRPAITDRECTPIQPGLGAHATPDRDFDPPLLVLTDLYRFSIS